MSIFDERFTGDNQFAKSNPSFLRSVFGSTDVMPLWIADMDFKVAPAINHQIKRLLDRGNFSYEMISHDVFKTIAKWNSKRNGLQLKSSSFLEVPGVLAGIALLVRELTQEGDQILIQTPVYHQFAKLITSANREVIENPLQLVNGVYTIDFEDLKEKFTSNRIKLMVLCNPHNPVGRVYNKQELQQLVDMAEAHDVTIISDEIHSDIIYAPHQFNSLISVDKHKKHIAVLGSPAKSFGVHSISNGYLYTENKAVFNQMKTTLASMYLDHGNVLASYVTLAAYNEGEEWLNAMIQYLAITVNWVEDFMNQELGGVKLYRPEGTYQIWLDFTGLGLSNENLNDLLVNQAKLGLTPGEWFGKGYEQHRRINIASPLAEVQEALQQLKRAIDEL